MTPIDQTVRHLRRQVRLKEGRVQERLARERDAAAHQERAFCRRIRDGERRRSAQLRHIANLERALAGHKRRFPTEIVWFVVMLGLNVTLLAYAASGWSSTRPSVIVLDVLLNAAFAAILAGRRSLARSPVNVERPQALVTSDHRPL